MSEQHLAPSTVAQYKGPPETVQVNGVWLEPGEIISGPLAISLLAMEDYFSEVDSTLSTSEFDEDDEEEV